MREPHDVRHPDEAAERVASAPSHAWGPSQSNTGVPEVGKASDRRSYRGVR